MFNPLQEFMTGQPYAVQAKFERRLFMFLKIVVPFMLIVFGVLGWLFSR